MTRRSRALAAGALGLSLLLAACADLPVPEPEGSGGADGAAGAAGPVPAVAREQAERVRAEVAERVLLARASGDAVDAVRAAAGPELARELLRQRVDGPSSGDGSGGADGSAVALAPAAAVLSPLSDGWPRWFLTVSVPDEAAPEPSVAAPGDAVSEPPADAGEPSEPVPSGGEAGGEAGGTAETLPVVEVYVSTAPREPYRLWGRASMLPGAELPALDPVETGSPVVDVVPAASLEDGGGTAEEQDGADDRSEGADEGGVDLGLLTALQQLLPGYVSVLQQGDDSPAAAGFEPDPFASALRARTEAEREAVSDVADLTVEHAPFVLTADDLPSAVREAVGEAVGAEALTGALDPGAGVGTPAGTLLAARTAAGDVLAVTAVRTTTTAVAREGTGDIRPGPQVAGAAGTDATDGTLTVGSVAVLVLLVPEERGAVRLLAVGEDLVAAAVS